MQPLLLLLPSPLASPHPLSWQMCVQMCGQLCLKHLIPSKGKVARVWPSSCCSISAEQDGTGERRWQGMTLVYGRKRRGFPVYWVFFSKKLKVRECWSCWGSHQQSSHVFCLSSRQVSRRQRCLQVTLILLHKISPQEALGQLLKGESHLKEQCKAGKKWGGIATPPRDMGTFAIGFLDTKGMHSALCSLQKPIAGVLSPGQHPAQQDPGSQLGFWDTGDLTTASFVSVFRAMRCFKDSLLPTTGIGGFSSHILPIAWSSGLISTCTVERQVHIALPWVSRL